MNLIVHFVSLCTNSCAKIISPNNKDFENDNNFLFVFITFLKQLNKPIPSEVLRPIAKHYLRLIAFKTLFFNITDWNKTDVT